MTVDEVTMKRIDELANALRQAERYVAAVMLTADIDDLIDIGDGKELMAQVLVAEGWVIPEPRASKEVQ